MFLCSALALDFCPVQAVSVMSIGSDKNEALLKVPGATGATGATGAKDPDFISLKNIEEH